MSMEMKIFTGNSNTSLVKEICDYLSIPLGRATVSQFSDGETQVRLDENVRGMDIFVIQSTSDPADRHLMEMLVMIDALKRASAGRITAVIPYFGYARQDRKDQPRVPITAKLISDLITTAGANRVLTMDLHAGQIQGFFNIPVDNLYATPILLDFFKNQALKDIVVVSPDAGGVERARAYAKRLKAGLGIIDKRREGPNRATVMNLIGDVKNKEVLMVDDMIDTAGTISEGAKAIHHAGAKKIIAGCTHGVLSGPAIQRLNESPIDQIVVTNTVPLNGKEQGCPKIKTLSVAPLLGEAIKRIHIEESVSSLFV
ncbi:MAG: ribose-phosphate pyrophosphokinase [Nitrospirae bacterium]|nr:ribose-phosphate pyrophosphokinase [Nitrospirota bacterium]MBI3351654.1 ribose-phosphate pyrophosphokinase [Nitrospirota bacterium]